MTLPFCGCCTRSEDTKVLQATVAYSPWCWLVGCSDVVLDPHHVAPVHDGTGRLDERDEAGTLLRAVAIHLDRRILQEIADATELLLDLLLDLGLDQIQLQLSHLHLDGSDGELALGAELVQQCEIGPLLNRCVEILHALIRALPEVRIGLLTLCHLGVLLPVRQKRSKTVEILGPVVCHLVLGSIDRIVHLFLSVGLHLFTVINLDDGEVRTFLGHSIRVVLPVTIPVRPREDPQTQGAEERTSSDAEDGRDRSGAVEALHTDDGEQATNEGDDDEDDREDEVEDVLHGFYLSLHSPYDPPGDEGGRTHR